MRYQLSWGNEPSALELKTTILTTSSIVGIAIGSIFGGDFIKYGRRNTVIRFNFIGLIGSVIALILGFW